jgi:hypothetical protein
MSRASNLALFRGQLGRDVRTEEANLMDRARDLAKQQKWTSLLGKGGSFLGTLAGAALAPMTGGMSVLAGKTIGSFLGSGLGQMAGRKFTDFEVGQSQTGLLGGDYATLKDLKGASSGQMFGEALGAGATTFALAGGADYLKGLGKSKDLTGLTEDASQFYGEAGKWGQEGLGSSSMPSLDTAKPFVPPGFTPKPSYPSGFGQNSRNAFRSLNAYEGIPISQVEARPNYNYNEMLQLLQQSLGNRQGQY